MKIACIAYLHGYGGAERQIITLANQMVFRDHEVYLIILAEDKVVYPIDSRVKVISLVQKEQGNRFKRIYCRKRELVNTLKALSVDIIINFNFQSAYFLALESKKEIGKIVYCERTNPKGKEYRGLLGLVRKLCLNKIDAFVFQTEGAQLCFKNISHVNNNSVIIPNACFLAKSIPYSGPREKRIVTVGRLSKQKNQQLLIDAFAIINNEFPEYILEIFGDGELSGEIEEHIKNLNLREKVFLRGTTGNIPDRIYSASLFVLSSDYEGVPNALIEAMALGIPCISTDCKPGGARTLINSGINGILTPRGDVINLAQAIRNLLKNSKMAERLAWRAVEIVDILNPNLIYDKWEAFLSGVCGKNIEDRSH